MRVYIAGPIGLGDHDLNIRQAIDAGQRLLEEGHTPFVPHLSSFWAIVHWNPWGTWLRYDKEWLKACDALIRLPGESAGATKEVMWAKELSIPVFVSVDEFLATLGPE